MVTEDVDAICNKKICIETVLLDLYFNFTPKSSSKHLANANGDFFH